MEDHGFHNFRYVRGLVGGASLHSVTFDGIEDFMSSPDAREAGVAVLLWGLGPDVTTHVLGSDSLAEVMGTCRRFGGHVREVARPIAVVSVPRDRYRAGAAEAIASLLRLRIELNALDSETSSVASRRLAEGFVGLPDDVWPLFEVILAEAPGVLGDDPFGTPATHH